MSPTRLNIYAKLAAGSRQCASSLAFSAIGVVGVAILIGCAADAVAPTIDKASRGWDPINVPYLVHLNRRESIVQGCSFVINDATGIKVAIIAQEDLPFDIPRLTAREHGRRGSAVNLTLLIPITGVHGELGVGCVLPDTVDEMALAHMILASSANPGWTAVWQALGEHPSIDLDTLASLPRGSSPTEQAVADGTPERAVFRVSTSITIPGIRKGATLCDDPAQPLPECNVYTLPTITTTASQGLTFSFRDWANLEDLLALSDWYKVRSFSGLYVRWDTEKEEVCDWDIGQICDGRAVPIDMYQLCAAGVCSADNYAGEDGSSQPDTTKLPVHLSFCSTRGELLIWDVNGTSLLDSMAAGNRTVDSTGDPYVMGSGGPAPNGDFPVQHVIWAPPPAISFGPAFFPIGACGTEINCRGAAAGDIARQRGIGIHGGRNGPNSPTNGCIRLRNADIRRLAQTYNPVSIHIGC